MIVQSCTCGITTGAQSRIIIIIIMRMPCTFPRWRKDKSQNKRKEVTVKVAVLYR